MTQQKRPLTGMTLPNSVATPPVAVPIGNEYLIHQVDASSPTTYLDHVTLFLRNTDVTDAFVSVRVCGSPPIIVAVPASSEVKVFSEQPFYGVPGQPTQSQILLTNLAQSPGNPVFAWGWFHR